MRRAIALATTTDAPRGPNPRVGAVIVTADGTVVGEGYHRGAGTPHAEVQALRAAGDRANGATAVVTLEPCAHTGRTGPCADALIAAGITRVVVAQPDTGALARGGIERLRSAGVEVITGAELDAARAVNPTFTRALDLQRPFVTWKYAATFDGRVAARDGSSRWITSPQARARVHELRAIVDAVIVGSGTARIDDPHLTVRDDDGVLASRQPLRVVVGASDLPSSLCVFDDAAPTIHLRTHDIHEVVCTLWQRGATHVLLEGGPTLSATFVRNHLVDEVIAFYGGGLLGAGAPLVGDLGIDSITQLSALAVTEVAQLGPDVMVVAHPVVSHETKGA